MQRPQRPDQQDANQRIERASLQELRIRRASPMPDARDAYDELKNRILQLVADDIGQLNLQDRTASRASIQAHLDSLLVKENIILKRHEKRKLSHDVVTDLLETNPQNTPGNSKSVHAIFYSLQDLVESKMLDEEAASFLHASVLARKNILISGQVRTGKTKLLRALCSLIPLEEQIVTIEDTAELLLDHKHLISLETDRTSTHQNANILAHTLIMTTARMSPDRLILGSLQGDEAYAWLQVISAGLRGSMATCMADSPQDGLARILAMALPGYSEADPQQMRSQIKSVIDLIVHLEKTPSDSPRVVSISEISAVENNRFIITDIY